MQQSWGGIRQYAIGLLKVLSGDDKNNYFIYHNYNDPEVLKLTAGSNVLNVVTDADVKNLAAKKCERAKVKLANAFKRIKIELKFKPANYLKRLCNKYSIDIIHCPYQFLPVIKGVKVVITMHDVQELYFPEYFSADDRAYRATAYLKFLRQAQKIVVSFQHVKDDLIRFFDIPSSGIVVNLIDIGKLWLDDYTISDKVNLDYLQIPERFLFYPANTWKHKNHIRLIEALAFLKDNCNIKVNVVFTGHQNFHFSSIMKRVEELMLSEQVFFLGIVDEKVLYSLYKSCVGVVIATTYEAGSFPLFESILLHVPVICSNVTSLPDTIKNTDFVFNPFSADDMSAKIEKLWNDDLYRNRSLANSTRLIPELRKERALPVFQNMYRSLSA